MVCVYETSGPTGRRVPLPATVNNKIHNIEQKIIIFLIARIQASDPQWKLRVCPIQTTKQTPSLPTLYSTYAFRGRNKRILNRSSGGVGGDIVCKPFETQKGLARLHL